MRSIRDNPPRKVLETETPVLSLKGVGPRRAAFLAGKGLRTVSDLLYFLPIRYEDRTRIVAIGRTEEGVRALIRGRVCRAGEEVMPRSRKRVFRMVVEDGTGRMELIWFHYARGHVERLGKPGSAVVAYGQVHRMGGRRQMAHPDVYAPSGETETPDLGFYPVYSAVSGVSAKGVRSLVHQAVSGFLDRVPDPVPKGITLELGLPGLQEALGAVHRPPPHSSIEDLNRFMTPFHRRLVFDRFLAVMLNLAFRKRHRRGRTTPPLRYPPDFPDRLKACLPYPLTGDQERAVRDILSDLASGRPMNRLLQGDVGCGKTAVALCAVHAVTAAGYQTALMVPSQVLAAQHYDQFKTLPASLGLRPVLLTGALRGPERRAIHRRIATGEFNLVIGTQALIQEAVVFRNLGLAVIDEQHRFGVRQRALLDAKSDPLHLLVMTATPIPRTLAMTVYGDLEISLIREYPLGRRPVATRLVGPGEKRRAFEEITERLADGGQVIVVCPLVEETEDSDLKAAEAMYERVRKVFSPPYRVGLIHGRLSPEVKDRVMEAFRKGGIHILIGTTVVEVGIDAPGARVILIEHPERFGLAQLHQLRGRVGRRGQGGLCLLMVTEETPPVAEERLRAFAACDDGFRIAEMDLEMRGQGELMGLRQAGAGELDFHEVLREPGLLKAARDIAERIAGEDPDLSRPEHAPLRRWVGVNPQHELNP